MCLTYSFHIGSYTVSVKVKGLVEIRKTHRQTKKNRHSDK